MSTPWSINCRPDVFPVYRPVRMRQPQGALMAQRTVIRLVDDLDGTEIVDGAGETVTFSFDGRQYEIDLTDDHADEMRGALDRSLRACRKVGGRQRQAPGAATVAKAGPSVDYSAQA